jgi:methylated-DNA-[protein]-cysteine S-methyltransferase
VNSDTHSEQEVFDGLASNTLPSAETMELLHRRLEASAQQAGILDIAYTTIDTPVGVLLLAATDRGLLRVAYESEDFDKVLHTLGSRISSRILKAPKRLDIAAFEIDEYFEHKRTDFDLPLDLSLSRGFRQLVQKHIPLIAYGTTESYKQVATVVGNPKAVRAVGSACATNPLPIVVPCHRVLRADGSLGGYIGGFAAKTTLLSLEAAA